MKKLYTLSIAILFLSANLLAQNTVESHGDTTNIKLKNTRIIIIGLDSADIDSDEEDDDEISYFQHWSGMFLGFNMLVNDQMSIARPAGAPFLELNHGQSIHFQFNFLEKTFPIVGNQLQFSTGLGIDSRSYSFRGNYTLSPGLDTVSASLSPFSLDRNRLNISGIRVPLLLGINSHKDPNKGLHITAGLLGAFNFSTNLNQKYSANGEKHVTTVRNSFNVNQWNVSAVAGVGIGSWIYVYSEYQLTSFFEKGLNPEVMPFTVGIRFIDFN